MAFGLLISSARQAAEWPFANAQADHAGRVDRPRAIETIATSGASHAR